MSIFRRIMLSSGLDIDALPDTQKIYYKATAKVMPKSNSLSAPLIANKWDASTGIGVIVCKSDIEEIGESAFRNCESLTSITIPDGVTLIGDNAFYGCLFTKETFINNSSLDAETKNYWGASIYDIIQEDGLCINDTIAVDCRNIATSVIIPDGVTLIGDYAFSYCESLTSVTIPDSVTEIRSYVFFYCISMQYYDFSTHESVPTLANTNTFDNIPSTCKIIVPDALYDEWIAATNWSTYARYIIKKSDWDASQTTE